MENEFVSYDIAVRLNKLGFDYPCLCVYNSYKYLKSNIAITFDGDCISSDKYEARLLAPLYQQVLKWFREVQKIHIEIELVDNSREFGYYYGIRDSNNREYLEMECFDQANIVWDNTSYDTYEACLISAIKKVLCKLEIKLP